MAWVQLMEDVLSAPPNTQPEYPAESSNTAPDRQLEEHLPLDMSTFDFERYLLVLFNLFAVQGSKTDAFVNSSEIWGDQTQVTGAVDVGGRYGAESGAWEDMVMRLSTGF